MLELAYSKTLDSHRVRLNNPRWCLLEVSLVLTDWHAKKIKHFDKTVKPVIMEALNAVTDDTTLLFSQVDKQYFHYLLGQAKSDDYLKLFHATGLVLESNKSYLNRLFELTFAEIDRINSLDPFDITELKQLNTLSDYLATELVNHGFSKGFLYSEISWLFAEQTGKTFKDAYNIFWSLAERAKEDFIIVFRLKNIDNKVKNINIQSEYQLTPEQILEYLKINTKAKSFFKLQKPNYYYIGVTASGWDYLSVIEIAKKELFATMDLLHLGYPENPFDFSRKCLVIGSKKRRLTNIQPVTYITDGYYKNTQELYETLHAKIKSLSTKRGLQKESFQKIISALRHLRLGRDSDELEQKFINFWIGLEYLFSNYDINDNTINRLKEYFIYAHATAYVKRNLTEYCQDIIRLKLDAGIPDFNPDLKFFLNPGTYDHIIANYLQDSPLLCYRASQYKMMTSGPLNKFIEKHKTNLNWHLTRCYRIRNEIVHDAAIHLNIESITGNLKYYLTFILNGLVYYLDSTAIDINMNGSLSIDDYFLLQEIRFNSLEKSGFKFDQLIAEKSATEIFS